jgi:hypothetical protein
MKGKLVGEHALLVTELDKAKVLTSAVEFLNRELIPNCIGRKAASRPIE